ncbi:MAG: isoamylase early set domain-containing protein [Candidatus Omnitrophota bacterium]
MKKKSVTFSLFAPQARSVCLAGSFNNWKSEQTPMKKDRKGNWALKLDLVPGRYEYRFWVDGAWQNDPNPVECVPNAFGTWNSVVEVI